MAAVVFYESNGKDFMVELDVRMLGGKHKVSVSIGSLQKESVDKTWMYSAEFVNFHQIIV